jgi:SAM-dependent methyltransferase
MTGSPACRFCGAPLTRTLVDLGEMPLANSFLDEAQLTEEEPRYPLHARVCDACLLVQVDTVVPPESIFGDYAYFSSYSDSWVEHARRFARSAVRDVGLGPESLVLEVASNDGYLLRHFRDAGIPVLGVEPAGNVAAVARAVGVETEVRFFGSEFAAELAAHGRRADLLVANNVLAHVPDVNDFVAGIATVLAPAGLVSIEVPHLLHLIQNVQFDTIYHEHFSYFSLATAARVLGAHGLDIFDVEELPTHGGSLRLWAANAGASPGPTERFAAVWELEAKAGLQDPDGYGGFAAGVDRCRRSLKAFLMQSAAEKKQVVAYGAAAKGNTLLNSCDVGVDDIAYVIDRSPHKQGKFLPGSHLPIVSPDEVFSTHPDYLLILPWNLRAEITGQMSAIGQWGGRFVIPNPETVIL